MKKIIICLFVVMVVILSTKGDNQVLIPSDAIRFRIIANSNSLSDQEMKLTIKEELEPVINEILTSSKTKEETKENISNQMYQIKNIVDDYNIDYSINYGLNYFPEKTYKGINYASGNYESLVITIGEGLGDNWWCVLFPPLCLLEASEEDYDEYTYTTYISEIINKYN